MFSRESGAWSAYFCRAIQRGGLRLGQPGRCRRHVLERLRVQQPFHGPAVRVTANDDVGYSQADHRKLSMVAPSPPLAAPWAGTILPALRQDEQLSGLRLGNQVELIRESEHLMNIASGCCPSANRSNNWSCEANRLVWNNRIHGSRPRLCGLNVRQRSIITGLPGIRSDRRGTDRSMKPALTLVATLLLAVRRCPISPRWEPHT